MARRAIGSRICERRRAGEPRTSSILPRLVALVLAALCRPPRCSGPQCIARRRVPLRLPPGITLKRSSRPSPGDHDDLTHSCAHPCSHPRGSPATCNNANLVIRDLFPPSPSSTLRPIHPALSPLASRTSPNPFTANLSANR